MKNHKDKLRDIFRIPKSIGMMPQVLGTNLSNHVPDRVTLSIYHLLVERDIPFSLNMASF